jgi:hypothetical protein
MKIDDLHPERGSLCKLERLGKTCYLVPAFVPDEYNERTVVFLDVVADQILNSRVKLLAHPCLDHFLKRSP